MTIPPPPAIPVKISALPAVSSVAATDLIPVVQSGVTSRATAAQIASGGLVPSGVTAGTYGTASQVGQFTVNAQGLLTSASDIAIAIAASQVTSGQIAVARGGTGADLSATGGANQFVRQSSAGAALSVGAIGSSDVPWSTPGTIGSVTPNTAAFTTLTTTGQTFLAGASTAAAARFDTLSSANRSWIFAPSNGGNPVCNVSGGSALHAATNTIFGESTTALAIAGPTPRVQVIGLGASSSSFGAATFSASANGPAIALGKSRGATAGTQTVVQSGDFLGQILFGGSDGTAIIVGARILAQASGTPGTNDMPTTLSFATTPDGAAAVKTALLINETQQLIAVGSLTARSGTAIPAGGTAGAGLMVSSTANFGVFFGSGAPSLSAAKGSLYLRSDGTTTNDRMYVNTNGTTGWTAVITAT